MTLRAYDWDRTLFDGGVVPQEPFIVISGRTWNEWDDGLRAMSQRCPVYIRGVGAYGDHQHAGRFKAMMINFLGVTEFYEDRDDQIAIIEAQCPNCKVIKVG